MTFVSLLWILIWGGMFSDISSLGSIHGLLNPLALVQGIRPLFPIAAVYLGLMWILVTRSLFPFAKTPLGFMFYYSLTGLFSSILLSPQKVVSVYWAALYISPFLVIWMAIDKSEILKSLKRITYINYAVVIFIAMSLIPEVIRIGGSDERFTQIYSLPFHLGEIRANGVGRFALLAFIIAFVRMVFEGKKKKYLWIVVILPSLFLLAQTRSRTSLLGLAVVSVLFVFLKGIDWRFLFVGPGAAYIIWLSGIKWRLHGQVEKIMDLTGREYTWQRGLEQIKQSPFFGWGFHADRLMLRAEHMHNSYLHAAIHSGLVGAVFFVAALVSLWVLIIRSGVFRLVRRGLAADKPILIESLLIISFLTERSFFESTA
ncbi:MAG: O-antigen ligase family protein, partial [Acidobacteriota bacterium]|nr:O-antigen ligase family protein [Acidobacteriota bacterium]